MKKKPITNFEQLVDEVFKVQEKLIRERYGKSASEQANYGWGQDGDDTTVSIATKVYVEGGAVLTTTASLGMSKDEFEHNWN